MIVERKETRQKEFFIKWTRGNLTSALLIFCNSQKRYRHFVKNVDETSTTFQVEEDIFRRDKAQKERVQMINGFNIHICIAFYADKILLFEGDTQRQLFIEINYLDFIQMKKYLKIKGEK